MCWLFLFGRQPKPVSRCTAVTFQYISEVISTNGAVSHPQVPKFGHLKTGANNCRFGEIAAHPWCIFRLRDKIETPVSYGGEVHEVQTRGGWLSVRPLLAHTVSSHNFDSQNSNVRVSNPNE